MPNFDGFTVALISQYDACTIPEYPPASGDDPFIETPPLFEPSERRVNVYAPTYPSSQFWVAYQIEPEEEANEMPYYYFKLFIDGRHIVSWGCGKRHKFQGKTMFALYQSPQHTNCGRYQHLESRVLFFGLQHDCSELDLGRNTMEVKIFRCRGRRAFTPELSKFKSSPASVFDIHQQNPKIKNEQALGLFDAGPLMGDQPRSYYQYSLLDPIDRPFIVFRYLFRSIPQLRKLGILPAQDDIREGETFNGPSKLFPTLSSRSMATSIASDTDIAKGLVFPLPVDSEQSPSPLRVPPILSIKTHRSPDSSDGPSPLTITVDLMETNFHRKAVGTRLFMNDNTPIHGPDRLVSIDESEMSGGGSQYVQTNAQMEKESTPPTDAAAREQILKDCVSELLGQGPWRDPAHPLPALAVPQPRITLKNSLENVRLHHSFGRKQTTSQSVAAPSRAETAPSNSDANNSSYQLTEMMPHSKPSHQQSMGSLRGALRSAMRRAPRAP